jgi:hypothetical protein
MDLKRMLAVFCLSAVVTSNAQAECSAISCENERILVMQTTAAGDVYIKTSGTLANLGCTLAGGVYMTLSTSSTATPRFKEIYATLLAHYMSDRPLSIRISDGSVGCTIAYIQAS